MANFSRMYERLSSYPKDDAQLNLDGRTHYVDDETLRYHHARIVATRPMGTLYALIESVSIDPDNTKRGFRYVVFDLFGNVVSNVSLEDCERTREVAHRKLDK